jgi:hypothetical protein
MPWSTWFVQILLAKGADVRSIDNTHGGAYGNAPQFASSGEHIDIVQRPVENEVIANPLSKSSSMYNKTDVI